MQARATARWRIKGPEMEGVVARWYAKLRRSGNQIEEYRKQAAQVTEGLPAGARVLEVAPGPGIPRRHQPGGAEDAPWLVEHFLNQGNAGDAQAPRLLAGEVRALGR